MPSKLEQATAALQHLTITELEHPKTLIPNQQAKLAASNKKRHLHELPAELRNRIYALMASEYVSTYMHRCNYRNPPPLLRVCKRLRSEFSSVLYDSENFSIELYDDRISAWVHIKDRKSVQAIMHQKGGIKIVSSRRGTYSPSALVRLLRYMPSAWDNANCLEGMLSVEGNDNAYLRLVRVPMALLDKNSE